MVARENAKVMMISNIAAQALQANIIAKVPLCNDADVLALSMARELMLRSAPHVHIGSLLFVLIVLHQLWTPRRILDLAQCFVHLAPSTWPTCAAQLSAQAVVE